MEWPSQSDPKRAERGPVVVTGSHGLVGRHVVAALTSDRALCLSVRAGDNIATKLDQCTRGCQPVALIHAGGRAHARAGNAADEEAAQRRDNHELTIALANAAAARGISRFVFVSTIQVVAARSSPGRPLCAQDPPAPASAYARAKHAAEVDLATIGRATGLRVAIVRPTLVYGAGARGNLARLARAIEVGLPLPLGGLENRRSLINARDLADLLVTLADLDRLPEAPLNAADAEPVSTTQLVRSLAAALDRPARLFALSPALLTAGLRILGQGEKAGQLAGNIEVDIAATVAATGWNPRRGLDEGLASFAAARR